MAQPSLSRTIARLERELGVPLFDRQGRRLRLNRFGAVFLSRVDRALGELDDARQELADAAGLEHGSVAVASETLLTLTGLLQRFRAEHPDVDLRLFQSSAELMRQQLHTGEVDLCFASQPLEDRSLHATDLVREEVLLAVPPDHHLAGSDHVAIDALTDEPFVTTRRGHWQRTLTDHLFAQAGLRPTIVCEGDEPAASQDLISAGLGIGLLPAIAQRTATHAPVAWLHSTRRPATAPSASSGEPTPTTRSPHNAYATWQPPGLPHAPATGVMGHAFSGQMPGGFMLSAAGSGTRCGPRVGSCSRVLSG